MKLMKKAQNHIKRFPLIIRYRFTIEVAILGTGLALDLMVTRLLQIINTPRYLTTEPRRQEQRLILKGNRNLEDDYGSFFLFFFPFFLISPRIGTKHDIPLSSKEYQPQKILKKLGTPINLHEN